VVDSESGKTAIQNQEATNIGRTLRGSGARSELWRGEKVARKTQPKELQD
jgi:hypothetical protein